SQGESLLRQFAEQREAASTDLAFEEAATIHARVEKLNPVVGQLPEIVRRLDRLNAVIIQPSHLPGSVAFFRIDSGRISGPVAFSIQPTEHAKSQSMEARVQELLQSFPPAVAKSAMDTMEHLATLKRWYYRGSRTGEIFFSDAKGELPMRRIVRGISRVFRGEKPEPINSPAGSA
ncbi:MAG: hypothetical protein ACJ713_01920, partial [Candidatus Sulfotelmatobacter sp.]